MKKAFLFVFLAILVQNVSSQTGKYFTVSGEKCKNFKVFIDYRIQQYCGTAFTINWSADCRDGYAHGVGKLTIKSEKKDRSFTMVYEGMLVKGKKEGKGVQVLYLSDYQIGDQLIYPAFAPFYVYKGAFKNDEFDGYGHFRSDYPYPVAPEDIGKGISMESLALESPIWRSELFFYEFEGNFTAGKIADTEKAIGKTKKMRWLGDLIEYKGQVKNGKPNGRGIATDATIIALMMGQRRSSASGNFVNGRLEGYGREVRSWSEYEGEFVNGLWEGKGKLMFYEDSYSSNNLGKISSVMEANFKSGVADGFCTIFYQNSAAYKYTGPVKNGYLEGTGEIEFLDGSRLRGNFRNGKMEGDGAITFANGDKFSGIYADDKPVRGTLYYLNGSKYEGSMSVRQEKDKITGKPIQIYIRQGRGTMTDRDGKTYAVNCDNNNCTESY